EVGGRRVEGAAGFLVSRQQLAYPLAEGGLAGAGLFDERRSFLGRRPVQGGEEDSLDDFGVVCHGCVLGVRCPHIIRDRVANHPRNPAGARLFSATLAPGPLPGATSRWTSSPAPSCPGPGPACRRRRPTASATLAVRPRAVWPAPPARARPRS